MNIFQVPDALGWPKSPYDFFHKIKDTFFIFTSIWSLSTSAGLLTMDHCLRKISSTKLCQNTFNTLISHSTSSIHCTSLFCISVVFLWNITFLEIIKHNMPKMLHIPSSILKWLHKNSSVLINSFKCTLICQLPQYSLTKLFWMKLKTTNHY